METDSAARLEVLRREPTGTPRPTPLLFVHGMWHGAWCWAEHFLPYFADRGYTSVALSLRGHGASGGRERLRWTRLSDYVADVAAVAGTLPGPPVVVGHSLGGAVAQHYLGSHPAAGGVLLAPVPPGGAWPATLRTFRRLPVPFLAVNLTLRLYPLVATPERARLLLFSDALPEAELHAYHARLQDESYRAYLDILGLDLPDPARVTQPVLVLGGGRDAIFAPREVTATARAYRTEPVLFPGMAHDMMLEPGWEAVAARVLSWLESPAPASPATGAG